MLCLESVLVEKQPLEMAAVIPIPWNVFPPSNVHKLWSATAINVLSAVNAELTDESPQTAAFISKLCTS